MVKYILKHEKEIIRIYNKKYIFYFKNLKMIFIKLFQVYEKNKLIIII